MQQIIVYWNTQSHPIVIIGFEAIAYLHVVKYFITVSPCSETSMGTGLDKSIRLFFSLNLRLCIG